jgi:bifunctional DNase/RNase
MIDRPMIEMKVSALSMDPFTNMPIIVLRDESGKHAVPIWVGLIEASAIVTEIEQIQLARPMTHDLLNEILCKMGARLERVEVTDVHEDTFYASIHLVCSAGKAMSIDARPSDAIALALRAGAPIHVARQVIEKARCVDLSKLGPFAWVAEAGEDGGEAQEREGMAAAAFGDLGDPDPLESSGALSTVMLEDLADEEFPKWKM